MKTGKKNKSGISIIKNGDNSKSRGRKPSTLLQGIHTCVIIVIMIALCENWFSIFEMELNRFLLYGYIILEIVCCMIILSIQNRKRLVRVTAICAYVIVAFSMRKVLAGTAARMINGYITRRNEYLHVENPLLQELELSQRMIAGSMAIMLLVLIVLLCYIAVVGKYKVLAGIIFLIPVSFSASIGLIPQGVSSWILIIMGSVYFYITSKEVISSGMWKKALLQGSMIGILLLILSVIAVGIQPIFVKYREENKESYMQIRGNLASKSNKLINMFYWDGNFAKAGVGNGNLKNLASNHFTGKEDLSVTLDYQPEETVYLKAYVGSVYTGEKWDSLSEKKLNKLSLKWDTSKVALEAENMPFNKIKKDIPTIKPHTLTVEILQGNQTYAYVPYNAQLDTTYEFKHDAYVKGENKKKDTISFYSPEQMKYLSRDAYSGSAKNWLEYTAFIEENYVQYPDNLTRFEELCKANHSKTKEGIAQFIQNKLKQAAVYDLSPGTNPSGKDFAEYFLFDNGKGFCVHFATTATLLYRINGIPARYVSGYAITPDQFIEQEDGTYVAVVTDEMAHAWCETFDDYNYKGWSVQDYTPGYQNNEENRQSNSAEEINNNTMENEVNLDLTQADETEPNESEPNKLKQNESQSNESEENKTGLNKSDADRKKELKKTKKQSTQLSIIYRILVVIILCGTAVVLLIIQAKIRLKKKYKEMHKRVRNIGIQRIYQNLYEICVFIGMKKSDPFDKKTLENMMTCLPQIPRADWEWVYQCVMRAAFSGELLTQEENKKMFGIYQSIRNSTIGTMSIWKKWLYRYVHCF